MIDPNIDVNPFIPIVLGETTYYSVHDAQVPLSWAVDNSGQRVEDVLYSIQALAPGDEAAGPIELCIEQFEPVYDPNDVPGAVRGTPFINSDGFVSADQNDYGLTGPFYVISDGNSTPQTGVPYRDGKYCVAGEFTGAADDWGAGIAFDVNNPPGGTKLPFDPTGTVAGFRVGLSGTTTGDVRVQFVVNEPQDANQPFLVGLLNTTAMYPIAWAQVPTSWDVAEAGREVESSLYSVQLYLEGDRAGPFDVCIDEFAPLTAAEMTYGAAAAASGFNGFRTVDPETLVGEYQQWKTRHFQDCGDGTACVPRDDGDCISEGIGYGMLLTVGFDDQPAFDRLWAYFQTHQRSSGMMNWQTTACGNGISDGAATDGDVDAAMALIQAACRWGGSYESDARALLTAIKGSAIDTSCAKTVLKPGDTFGGCSETNPSYVAPGYYKEFQKLDGDPVWTALTDDGYDLLAGNQQRKGGVFSDWSNQDGGPSTGNHSDDFGPDASRVPWRVATDYVWNGEPRAVPLLETFASHVESQGGVARAFTPNSNYRGGSALSSIHSDAATAHEYADAWLLSSVDDNTYFPGTLRPLYMMLAANTFERGCN